MYKTINDGINLILTFKINDQALNKIMKFAPIQMSYSFLFAETVLFHMQIYWTHMLKINQHFQRMNKVFPLFIIWYWLGKKFKFDNFNFNGCFIQKGLS